MEIKKTENLSPLSQTGVAGWLGDWVVWWLGGGVAWWLGGWAVGLLGGSVAEWLSGWVARPDSAKVGVIFNPLFNPLQILPTQPLSHPNTEPSRHRVTQTQPPNYIHPVIVTQPRLGGSVAGWARCSGGSMAGWVKFAVD